MADKTVTLTGMIDYSDTHVRRETDVFMTINASEPYPHCVGFRVVPKPGQSRAAMDQAIRDIVWIDNVDVVLTIEVEELDGGRKRLKCTTDAFKAPVAVN